MKARVYTFTLLLLILSVGPVPLQAQDSTTGTKGYPALEPSIEITDLRLLGAATKGATVTLQVRFRAHVDAPGELMLRYPKHVAPPGRRPGEKFRTHSLSLKAGKQYVKTYPLRVTDTGGAMVEAIVRAEDIPEGYDASDSEYLTVNSGVATYQVSAPGDTTRRRLKAKKGGGVGTQALPDLEYTISVSGEVKFYDRDQFREEGLYGVEVELWFRDRENSDELYHPETGNVEHTRYDVVAENREYHFNFTSEEDNLLSYEELLVLVRPVNSAAALSVEQGAWIKETGDGSEVVLNSGQGVVYDISNMSTDISLSDADVEVNSEDGAILRNMLLGREFVRKRYDNSLPFDLSGSRCTRSNLMAQPGASASPKTVKIVTEKVFPTSKSIPMRQKAPR